MSLINFIIWSPDPAIFTIPLSGVGLSDRPIVWYGLLFALGFIISQQIMIYISIFAMGSVVMGILGLDFMTAIGSVATCLGNIGPGLGSVGPVDNFAHLPNASKWVLSFLMLLGRLELFTVLILFTPYFWNKI